MDNLTVVIPFFNGHSTIARLLRSLPVELPVVIIDDLSDVGIHVKDQHVQCFRLAEKGYFSGAVNAGIQQCQTDVLVLNQDVRFKGTRWLELLAEQRQKFALIGERIQGSHPAWPKGYVHGVFMYMRRDAIEQVGLLNEIDYPLWGSTGEWQARAARAGYKILPLEQIPGLIHERDGNFGSSIQTILQREPQKRQLLIRTPPAVSVIIPAFNYGRYLPDAVASLVGGETSLGFTKGQTFQSFEIVIVDDASTDNTAEVARSLADPYKGIRFVQRQKNGGTSAANNTGIQQAYGQYVTILCADDMREPFALEHLYRVQLKYPDYFVYDDIRIFKNGQRNTDVWRMKNYDFEVLLNKNHIHAGLMFPKKAWEDVGGYPENMIYGREDWAFNVALGIKGWCGVHVDSAGYLYRREKQNRSLRNTTPQWHQRFLRQLMGLFPDVYAGERPMGCCGGRSMPAPHPLAQGGASANGREALLMAGEKGMILVEYLGSNEGVESYYGPVTGTRYKFSVRKNIGRIDIRDAKTQHNRGLLDLYDKGRKLFQEYRPQPQLAVSKEEAEQVNVQDVSDQPAAPPPQAKPFSEVELPDTVEVAVGAGELQPAEDVLVATQPDELTTIKGIGPKTALKLKAAGIVSFVQLAELTPAALAELALIPEHQAQKILAEVFKIFA